LTSTACQCTNPEQDLDGSLDLDFWTIRLELEEFWTFSGFWKLLDPLKHLSFFQYNDGDACSAMPSRFLPTSKRYTWQSVTRAAHTLADG
jgi:hypothetical protein